MADLTELEKFDEAMQSRVSLAPVENATQTANIDELAKFDAAMSARGEGINLPPTTITATPSLTPAERFGRRDEAGEPIPFDVKRGLGDRLATWRVAQQSGDEAKLQVLQQLYPNKRARILPTGDLTVELTDSETGKPKEVLVDPDGIGEIELMELASQMPEIAAGTAAAIASRGTGFMKTAAQIVLSSLASAGAGAAKDIALRSVEPGVQTNLGEIASRRSTEAALDMFLQTGGAGAAKSLRALSPFARDIKPGTKEFDAARGREFFKRVFGEDVKLTPAEATGSPALRALEAMESKMPGARTLMTKFRESGDEAIARIQKRATGELVPEEAIGESGIGTVRRELVEPLEKALEQTRTSVAARGNQRIKDILDEATGIGGPGEDMTLTQAGGVVLEDFDTRLAQAERSVNLDFAKVRSLPGGSGDVLDGTAAANAAAAIRKELPTVLKKEGRETLTSGVPEGLLKALDDLEKLRGGKVSLQTLTNMKKAAYDSIAAFKTAHGDVKDRWFTKIAQAYEQGIDAGIDATGDAELRAALTTAKETYKRELLPFERPGLKELAKDEFTGGRLSPIQVVNRFFEGPKAVENFSMLKEVLGESSPAFRVMKRAWADTKLEAVTDPITKTIKPRELQLAIQQLPKELRTELLGKHADALDNALNLQTGLKELKSLDSDSIRALLAIKDPGVDDLKAVIRMQGNVDTAYINSIVADVADGLPIASKLKPTEFVKKLLNTSTPTKDVSKVLTTLAAESPETREAISKHTFYQLLDAASYREADTAGKLIAGEPLRLSPIKLAEALGRPGTASRNRYELLLGTDKLPEGATRLEVLENLVKTLAPREGRDAAFGATGGMAQGTAIQLSLSSPLKYAWHYTKKAAYAALYLDPRIAKLVTNQRFSGPETAAIANTLIASEPFLRNLVDITGDEIVAGEVVSNLKQSIDRFVDEWQQSPAGRESEATARFLGGEKVPMQIQGAR